MRSRDVDTCAIIILEETLTNRAIYMYSHQYLYGKMSKKVMDLSSSNQPKARFYTRLNEQDFLGLTVWRGKTDTTAEVIVVQVRRRNEDVWETVGRLAVYRTSDGIYSKLPERRETSSTYSPKMT